MKKHTFIILCSISLITFLSAVFLYVFNIKEEYRTTGSFHQLEVNGPIQVFLIKGLRDSIHIVADKGLADSVTSKVIDERLIITASPNTVHERVLKVMVSSDHLNKIILNGPSSVEMATQVTTDTFSIFLHQSSEARIHIDCKSLQVELNGSSNVFMAGKTDVLNMKILEYSDVVAYNLESRLCNMDIQTPKSSEGIIRVNVSDTLKATMAPESSRTVYYKGTAQVIASDVIKNRVRKKE